MSVLNIDYVAPLNRSICALYFIQCCRSGIHLQDINRTKCSNM